MSTITYGPSKRDQIIDRSITSIKSNVATIGERAFSNCTQLTSAEFPKATSIGQYAFNGCTNLTTLDFLGSATSISTNTFTNTYNLKHVIIRSPVMQNIAAGGWNGALPPPLKAYNGAVYVPSELVSTYQNNSKWSPHKRIIHSIDEFPVSDFSSIKDDWETIISNPNYATDYKIGDTKAVTVNGYLTYMQIAAFNTDTLSSDSTKTANITWISAPLTFARRMHSSASTSDGWASCEGRSYLRNTVFPTLPDVLKNNIKEVNKTYYDFTTTSTLSCADTIWVPSTRELNASANESGKTINIEDSGPIYSSLFPAASRVKVAINNSYQPIGGAWVWWTRSPANATQYHHVIRTSTGAIDIYYAANSTQVYMVFGFCT